MSISDKILSLNNDNYIFVKLSRNTDNRLYEMSWSQFPQTGTFPNYGQHQFIPGTGITTYTHSIIGRNINTDYLNSGSLIQISLTNNQIKSDKQTVVGLFKHSKNQIVILFEENSELFTY